jgi:hypothetical protein
MQFEVLQDGLRYDSVWLWGQNGRDVILGAISHEALQDDCDPPQSGLTQDQLIALATANVVELSRVLAAKVAAGEAFIPKPGDRPRVFLRTGDLPRAGVKLSASCLGMATTRRLAWA